MKIYAGTTCNIYYDARLTPEYIIIIIIVIIIIINNIIIGKNIIENKTKKKLFISCYKLHDIAVSTVHLVKNNGDNNNNKNEVTIMILIIIMIIAIIVMIIMKDIV